MEQTEAEEILDELLALEAGLSSWELDFIESLDGQRDRGFSEKQMDVLRRMEEKYLR